MGEPINIALYRVIQAGLANNKHAAGLGLTGLHERIAALDGEFQYGLWGSGDFRIGACVPLPRPR